MKIKTKKVLILVAVLLMIFCLTGCFNVKDEIQSAVEKWEKRNGITIKGYTYTTKTGIMKETDGTWSITIEWDGFEELTPAQMKSLVKSWDSYHSVFDNDKIHTFSLDLDYIVSNSHTYEIWATGGEVKLDGKTIVERDSSTSSSSSSSSSKTATCNYCHGTGKVNGDKCPWCNGSGKTYDNVFNDALGG